MKSKYEEEFRNSPNVKYIETYNGYDIYSYLNIIDMTKYTFWTSSHDEDYYSNLNTINGCKSIIDKLIAMDEK